MNKRKFILSKSGAGENYENYAERSHEWPINASVLDQMYPPCSPEALVAKQKQSHFCPLNQKTGWNGKRKH